MQQDQLVVDTCQVGIDLPDTRFESIRGEIDWHGFDRERVTQSLSLGRDVKSTPGVFCAVDRRKQGE